uniref:Uncharacterized protein n=1 Tax=Oryza glumipatula TaxID=40148 RepID=A0A0D9Z5K1_9ORYZ
MCSGWQATHTYQRSLLQTNRPPYLIIRYCMATTTTVDGGDDGMVEDPSKAGSPVPIAAVRSGAIYRFKTLGGGGGEDGSSTTVTSTLIGSSQSNDTRLLDDDEAELLATSLTLLPSPPSAPPTFLPSTETSGLQHNARQCLAMMVMKKKMREGRNLRRPQRRPES